MVVALSHSSMVVRSTEVSVKRTRRSFTTAEKLRVVREADACTERGALGALLRREGLYASQLTQWRAASARGELHGTAKRRGPTPKPVDPSAARIAELERALRSWSARCGKRRRARSSSWTPKKKFSQLLGLTLPPLDPPTESR